MALQHLRSSTADKRPTPGAMSDGQLAMNTNLVSPGLFLKDSNGDLVKVGPVHVGTTAPNATPGAGGQAGNSKGELWLDTSGSDYSLKTWDGTAFRAIVVTSTMIKDGTILDADINASAGIVDTKLATISTAGKVSGTAITSGTIATSGSLEITNTTPTVRFLDTDVTSTYRQTAVQRNGDQFIISTRDSTGTLISSDYVIATSATGATGHSWRIAGTEKANLGSGGLTVVDDLTISDKIIHDGDTNTAIRFPAADTVSVETAGTERMRIDSSGRLLVGTSSALTTFFGTAVDKLAIAGGAAPQVIGCYVNNQFAARLDFLKSRSGTVNGQTVVQVNDTLGEIYFGGSDGTAPIPAARVHAEVDGTPGTNDMPGRLVFSTTADGSASPTEAFRITNDRVRAYNQAAPATVNTTATITAANLKTGIITSTTAAAVTMTLPTGTDIEAGFSGIYTNMTFEFSVINTGPNALTVGANGNTTVGSLTVATLTSARYALRRTGANAFTLYRLS